MGMSRLPDSAHKTERLATVPNNMELIWNVVLLQRVLDEKLISGIVFSQEDVEQI